MLKLQPYFTNIFNFTTCMSLYIYVQKDFTTYLQIYIDCVFQSFFIYIVFFMTSMISELLCEKKISYNCLTYSPEMKNNKLSWYVFNLSHLLIVIATILYNYYNTTRICTDSTYFINVLYKISFSGALLLWLFNTCLYAPGKYYKGIIVKSFIEKQLHYYNILFLCKYIPDYSTQNWFFFQIFTMFFDSFYHVCPLIIMSKIYLIDNLFTDILYFLIILQLWAFGVAWYMYGDPPLIFHRDCWGPYKDIEFTKINIKKYITLWFIVCLTIVFSFNSVLSSTETFRN